MLLLDDSDQLPVFPGEAEARLADALGPAGLLALDERILSAAQPRWLKMARVAIDALKAGGLPTDEDQVQLHLRRMIALVEAGELEAQGSIFRPRFGEVRLPIVVP